MASLRRPLRFAGSGVLNTVLGYSVILTGRWLGLPELAANALGYAFGLVLSFALSRGWVFADRPTRPHAAARFLAVAALAWGCNALAVAALLHLGVAPPLAHALGIPVYTVLVYLGCSIWVFTPGRATPP